MEEPRPNRVMPLAEGRAVEYDRRAVASVVKCGSAVVLLRPRNRASQLGDKGRNGISEGVLQLASIVAGNSMSIQSSIVWRIVPLDTFAMCRVVFSSGDWYRKPNQPNLKSEIAHAGLEKDGVQPNIDSFNAFKRTVEVEIAHVGLGKSGE